MRFASLLVKFGHLLNIWSSLASYPTESYTCVVLGLPGSREAIRKRNSDHRDYCRFNRRNEVDAQEHELFDLNLKHMCKQIYKEVGRHQGLSLDKAPTNFAMYTKYGSF
jgi:hypothetical protein